MAVEKKPKIAIVGGGCGALAAAFELSKTEKYDITIYQMGWRLGGKGASGRNKDSDKHNRTEEHGLHVWMGFYENAFRLIRECYDALPKDDKARSPFHKWDDAFMPDHWVGVADQSLGVWRTWSAFFPAAPGLPGDPIDPDTNPFLLQSYLARACDLLRALIHSGYSGPGEKPLDPNELSSVTPETIVDKITNALRTGVLTGASALYESMAVLGVVLSGRFSLPGGDYLVLRYADAVARNVRTQAETLFGNDQQLGPKLELVELVVTVIVGVLRDRLLSDPDGLDAINDEDCQVWLRRHGASERAVDSPLVRALYDMAFANVKTSKEDVPGLAAGQALRGALRMFFTYRGSLFWKMRAGMGDAVFSPLYEVLKSRDVKFEFFHELTDVVTNVGNDAGNDAGNDGPRVKELWFRRQAEVAAGKEYDPLDEHGCWPATPKFGDLIGCTPNGADFEIPRADPEHRESYRVTDFDCVILGVPVGAIAAACPSLVRSDKRWQAMVQNLKTVPTQALQLWLYEGVDQLTATPTPITVSGFKKPFDTWSDMTHVIAQERWTDQQRPQGLLYLCGALPYVWSENRPLTRDEALDRAVDYLDRDLTLLLTGTGEEGRYGFRWELLSPPQAEGAPRPRFSFGLKREELNKQYFSVNVNPSDLYVLTRPGTMQYRISPLDPGYENMTVAGDWTDCGFNEGCVEAAIMSGMLASHAVCGEPKLEDIVGYDHP